MNFGPSYLLLGLSLIGPCCRTSVLGHILDFQGLQEGLAVQFVVFQVGTKVQI